MDKASKIFNRILMCLFTLLISAGPVLRIITAEGKSYAFAFGVAVAVLAACVFFIRKLHLREKINSLNPVRCCAVLSAACLAVKLAWVLIFRIEPTVDYATFYSTARAFAGENGFNAIYLSAFPHIMGYGLFLGSIFKVFGSGLMVAPTVNVLLSLATGLMIFFLLSRYSGLYSACLGYALWTICPSATLYNTMTLSEPYYTCMFFAFFCIVSFLDRKNSVCRRTIAASTLCGAVAGLLLTMINAARPIAAVAIISFFIWFLLLRGEKSFSLQEVRKFAPFAILMILVYIISSGAWNAKMEKTLGIEVSSFPGYSVFTGFDPDTLGTYDDNASQLFFDIARDKGAETAHQELFSMAKENIFSGKINFAELLKNKFIVFLGDDEGGAYYSLEWLSGTQYSILVIISNIFYYLLIILCVFSVFREIKDSDFSAMSIVPLCVVGIILAQMLVEVAGRYHYSVIPMIIAAACVSMNRTMFEKSEADYE